MSAAPDSARPPSAAVLVTCLAEAFAPEVAEAAAELVARTGAAPRVDLVGHGCCGQPAWNAGYPEEARALALRMLRRLAPYALVVVPSGSCATMLLRYYPHLFPAGTREHRAAQALAARSRELSAFLADHAPGAPAAGAGGTPPPPPTDQTRANGAWDAVPRPQVTALGAHPPARDPSAALARTASGTTAFHPSCHSLRGAFVGDAGQRCLTAAGVPLCAHAWPEECCGFGGLFAAKEPALSTAMADAKLDSVIAAGAQTLVTGEMGCLLHLEGRARRRGLRIRFRHLAEVLRERTADG